MSVLSVLRRSKGFAGSALAYLVCACLAYLPVLTHGQFLCDDFILLARIRQGLDVWNYQGADFYRPSVSLALHVLWTLFGNNPFPYYVFNVLLLVGSGLLLRAIWIELVSKPKGVSGFDRTALAVGLMFVLWVMHSEAVSWISGMTDTLSVFFGAAGLLAFIRYRLRPTLLSFAVTVGLLWLGLIAKEAIVTWIVIFLVVSFTLLPDRTKWRLRIPETVFFCLLGAVYVVWRTHVIGHLIGGYGAKAQLNISLFSFSPKVAKQLANAFVPFNKTVGLWMGLPWVPLITAIVCGGAAALVLRKWPKSKPTPPWVQPLSVVLVLLGLSQAPQIIFSDLAQEDFAGRILAAQIVVLVFVAAAFYKWRERLRLDSPWGFALVSFLAYMVYSHSIDKVVEWAVLICYLGFAFFTRPTRERSEEEWVLIKVAIVCFAATILAGIPSLPLRIELSGQDSRFSYGPSFFSMLSIASVVLLYVKAAPAKLALAVPALAGLGFLLFENNIPWAQASDLSAQTSHAIRRLLPARRIYVLCVPAAVDAAILLRIGIEHVAEVTCGDDKVQVHVASYDIDCIAGDEVRATQLDTNTYQLSVVSNMEIRRFQGSMLINAEHRMKDGWFTSVGGSGSNVPTDEVKLLNYDPKMDHIMIVDCKSARVIR